MVVFVAPPRGRTLSVSVKRFVGSFVSVIARRAFEPVRSARRRLPISTSTRSTVTPAGLRKRSVSFAGRFRQRFADGSVKWQEKKALGKGAIGFADGMLYCHDEKTGTVALIDASPNGWTERGRFKLDPQTTIRSPKGAIWVHPVISNGKLYLRDQNYIYCYNVKG